MPHAPARLLAPGLLLAEGWADRAPDCPALEGTPAEPEGTLDPEATLQPGARPTPE